jgi:hypothetical protein
MIFDFIRSMDKVVKTLYALEVPVLKYQITS